MPETLGQTIAGFLGETTPRPPPDDARRPNVVEATPYNDNNDTLSLQTTNVVQGLTELHQSLAEPESEPLPTWNMESQSTASSIISMDAKNPSGTTHIDAQWSEEARTISSRREGTPAPINTPQALGGDLTGVGSQYDIANRSTSAILANDPDKSRKCIAISGGSY
jgi:hypothetical protein